MNEIEFKIVEIIDSDNGDGKNNIVIKMISLYKDGKFVRHLKLTPKLANWIKNKRIEVKP